MIYRVLVGNKRISSRLYSLLNTVKMKEARRHGLAKDAELGSRRGFKVFGYGAEWGLENFGAGHHHPMAVM